MDLDVHTDWDLEINYAPLAYRLRPFWSVAKVPVSLWSVGYRSTARNWDEFPKSAFTWGWVNINRWPFGWCYDGYHESCCRSGGRRRFRARVRGASGRTDEQSRLFTRSRFRLTWLVTRYKPQHLARVLLTPLSQILSKYLGCHNLLNYKWY